MTIDNNQLVARYMKLQAGHKAYFAAISDYVDQQLDNLYAKLTTTFQDTLTLSVQGAIDYAKTQNVEITSGINLTLATQNFIIKMLDNQGLLVEGGAHSSDVVIGKLNFENRARYV
ncbi:hypothetical protein [Lacticaseibacillus pantheris]|jgi:hypothetical protein|uniref:Uncharacterized protein n=1 Tax=Lacticaseibacillus pantheris DSM 15945 = JCM 12539 = NBRC 106106 TaxID=1423783 RepID=A0A0R1U4X4_9LACO|nr:hypothetical protein [Lacticaseibacillus pantheris]KRL86034.1 hypothetical protein FC50_GL001442 [Lacticaseibacillus pantheris DSM 15945 = JCM 12539 = NBRC 106106]WKF84948.1 hypothetical protein QY874_11830 [Lacticaseibacillus pantheris]